MGIFCTILAILITVFVLMIGQYNDTIINITVMYLEKSYNVSFLVWNLIVYSLGILSGVLLMLASFFEVRNNCSKLRKKYDKASINSENSDERIKILENKIKTLEAALKKQIEG